MNIQVFNFNSSWIIADISDIESAQTNEYGKPDCLLKNPCEISSDGITIWPPYTNETTIAIRSSEISVMVDPTHDILRQYLDIVNPKSIRE